MLQVLDAGFAGRLSEELEALSDSDRQYFHPHEFDVECINRLATEEGNHYYIYLDRQGDFAGYGMLRTFGQYEIPTLGCVIWQRWRGRGYGKSLVHELVDKAVELNYSRIRLKVARDNTVARALYKRAGFREIGDAGGGQVWMEYTPGEVRSQC